MAPKGGVETECQITVGCDLSQSGTGELPTTVVRKEGAFKAASTGRHTCELDPLRGSERQQKCGRAHARGCSEGFGTQRPDPFTRAAICLSLGPVACQRRASAAVRRAVRCMP